MLKDSKKVNAPGEISIALNFIRDSIKLSVLFTVCLDRENLESVEKSSNRL